MVTGASDGIGEAYSYELAKSGFNIVLVSRTEEKLQRVALKIRQEYKVQTRIIQYDFEGFGSPEKVRELYDKFDSALADISQDICILANNAGKAHVNLIHNHSVEMCFNMVNVNVNAVMFVARYFLALFKQRFEN